LWADARYVGREISSGLNTAIAVMPGNRLAAGSAGSSFIISIMALSSMTIWSGS
jgi:hypothetical protein